MTIEDAASAVPLADGAQAAARQKAAIQAATIFARFHDLTRSLDVSFVLLSASFVFAMQIGFAMLTVGSIRTKNAKNVLLKNVLDACVGALAYFLFGWGLAFGPDGNSFAGWGQFALTQSADGKDVPMHLYFFQWAFAATATTIVSGAVAERTSFCAYLAYAFILTGFVYPIAAHWVWGDGWLSTLYSSGVVDFAGGMVVHTVGGFSALAGSVIVGPRLGRFDSEGGVVPIPGHSATMVTLGTFLLWFGWYGFNPGSVLTVAGSARREAVARAAVNTTLSGTSGGLTALLIAKLRFGIFDLPISLNGILAGLVSVSACCPFVEPWVAIVTGVLGGVVYTNVSNFVLMLLVDDPLDSFAIHGACGAWGVIAGALFNRGDMQARLGFSARDFGLLRGGGANLLAVNTIGLAVIALWTFGTLGTLFFVLNKADLLRISPHEEIIGNDVSKHGNVAYPCDTGMETERVHFELVERMENALVDIAKAPVLVVEKL